MDKTVIEIKGLYTLQQDFLISIPMVLHIMENIYTG